jgi:hypothetical protein
MSKKVRIGFTIAICIMNSMLGSRAMAEHTTEQMALYNTVPSKGKQIALDEAMALDFAAEHVRIADEIAARMLPQINNSTTGWFGSVMLHFHGSAASLLATDSNDFTSEAATAFEEITLLNGGIENSLLDTDYKKQQEVADSIFTLRNRTEPNVYRIQLQNMLQTLRQAVHAAAIGFKAKWGVSYAEALRH